MTKLKPIAYLILAVLILGPAVVQARKTTYVFSDRRFTNVKRIELKKKELKEREEVNHPYTFTELQLRNMLAPIKMSRKFLLKKGEEEEYVFNKLVLDLILPHLVKGFSELQPNEEMMFSYVVHNPKFLIRDDRLNVIHAWVAGDKLNLRFRKLMAKLPNDYDKLSDISEAMNRARGVRVSLELIEGQEYGESTDHVLIRIPSPENAALAELKGPAQTTEALPLAEHPKTVTKAATPIPSPEEVSDTEARLQELKNLKDKNLISDQEYKAQKKEVLKDL